MKKNSKKNLGNASGGSLQAGDLGKGTSFIYKILQFPIIFYNVHLIGNQKQNEVVLGLEWSYSHGHSQVLPAFQEEERERKKERQIDRENTLEVCLKDQTTFQTTIHNYLVTQQYCQSSF